MIRVIKKLIFNNQTNSIVKSVNQFLFSSSTPASPSSNTVPQIMNKNQFISNLYGIEIKKHIFPNFTKKIPLSQEQLKFYQKTSPNYIVALVSKVIDESQILDNAKEGKKQIDINNRFYQVCTYCKTKYSNNGVQLQGLYKVKIQNIHKFQLKSTTEQLINQNEKSTKQKNQQNAKDQAQEQDTQDVDDSPSVQQSSIQAKPNQFSISQIIKNSLKKPRKQKKNQFFSVKVKKIQELPLIPNQILQMKFKFLIDTYLKTHRVANQKYPIIFNIIDLHKILNNICNECSQLNNKKQDVQACLQAQDPQQRVDKVQKLLLSTMQFSSYLSDIQRAAQDSLRNKKFFQYYSQIMKIAKQVIDGKKSKQIFLEKCVSDFQKNNPTEAARQAFQQEKEKYEHMDQNSMEAGVIKTYIEELSKIPYNVKSQQTFDLQYAQKALQQEHYGMKEVKDAILEIIAVGKLKGTLKGKIFCFVGGPGLGKTTIAKSVAKALNRKFFNISLGGVSDSSVLKGHRRTYVGAYSGKIIEALKSCGTNNPVILLDEIDKMGSSYHGDPRSELLQILDPNQNSSFIDNFVDIPVDLSNVLFICSANYQQNISKPLIDRMEKIKLNSYTNFEKTQIFKRHLLRRAIDKSGVLQEQFSLNQEVIQALVEDYCMGEPGVRYLQKNIISILQKVAYKIVTNEEPLPISIEKSNLSKYLGNTYFRIKDHTKITKGVAISLGGGQYGGRLTYIQAFKKSHLGSKEHKRGVLFTGSLGDIFKQAMNISYSYARNFLKDLGNTYLYQNQVHIHAPDGAQKKDGSTDSLTISSALISLALNKQAKKGVGLTGELTLHGKVLRTFGIKEKVLVAKRQKLSEVIVPFDNFAQVQMLTPQVKQGITFHFVKNYQQVYDILFGEDKLAEKIKPVSD